MIRTSLVALALIVVCGAADAQSYPDIKCSDLQTETNWAPHIIGWLNLGNRNGSTEYIDFSKAHQDAIALERTCKANPEMMLHSAVEETFSLIGDEGGRGLREPAPIGE